MVGIAIEFDWNDTRSDAMRGLNGVIAALDDKWALYDTIGSGLENSAVQRISVTNLSPDGNPWPKSHRVQKNGGTTLSDKGYLRQSISHQAEVVSRMLWKFPGGVLRACEGSVFQAARSRGIGSMG